MVKTADLWEAAKSLPIRVSGAIAGNFDIGFDDQIPEETKDALMRFVYWVEDHYHLPVTLWVDFKYRHYLMDRRNKRTAYRFYWADFKTYPAFDDSNDIPVIELAVRTEHTAMDEILASFIEAITHYFAWLSQGLSQDFQPNPELTESILRSYRQWTQGV